MGPLSASRIVILDPGHSSSSGHHAEVNRHLLVPARSAGLAIECWVDQAFSCSDPGYRPVFKGCGYVDPRHWLDLPGSLHLARRLSSQLQAAAAGPVHGWIAHSLLPFQLIGLAQFLQHQPAAKVELGILYAPGERLGGSSEPSARSPGPERERDLAIANARLAWSGLSRAVASADHQLRLGCSSQLQASLHQPLLTAAGLPPAQIQPAVVGGGWQLQHPALASTAADAAPLVLLHWGDLKPGKGRQQVIALLEALLSMPPAHQPCFRWLFHYCSRESLSPQEHTVLEHAQRQVTGFELWQGAVSTEAMQDALARTAVALLPYCPSAYAERSSGVLWCYGAARLAAAEPARAVGYASGWLAEEARALGMGWQGLPAGEHPPKAWLTALDRSLTTAAPAITAYGRQVLGQSYVQWVLSDLHSSG